MSERILDLAARIVSRSSPERPADAALREELRSAPGISRAEGALVSQAVFAYFRWKGWAEEKAPINQQLLHSLELAREFALRPDTFSDAELVKRGVPQWLGEVMEISPEWVRAIQQEPALWLRARPGQGSQLASRLGDCLPAGGQVPDALAYSGPKDLFRTPEFQAGYFEVQDLSSQAVGVICSPKPGETWWDACAGEGGKLLHLSDLMENRGLIWASDKAEWRLRKLQRRAARAKVFNYRLKAWDGGRRLPVKTQFDGILVDAPCSGIGTWQRNPQARWTATPKDVRELAIIQKQLLARVAVALKPGGRLVYAVCTLARDETIEVAKNFDDCFPGIRRLEISNPVCPGSLEELETFLRTEETGSNGMYISAWRHL